MRDLCVIAKFLVSFCEVNFSRNCRNRQKFGRVGVICAECGGDLTTPTGTLSSPNYPGLYAHARRCHWIIRVAPTQRISLTFVDLDIQSRRIYGRRRTACVLDNVMVPSTLI